MSASVSRGVTLRDDVIAGAHALTCVSVARWRKKCHPLNRVARYKKAPLLRGGFTANGCDDLLATAIHLGDAQVLVQYIG